MEGSELTVLSTICFRCPESNAVRLEAIRDFKNGELKRKETNKVKMNCKTNAMSLPTCSETYQHVPRISLTKTSTTDIPDLSAFQEPSNRQNKHPESKIDVLGNWGMFRKAAMLFRWFTGPSKLHSKVKTKEHSKEMKNDGHLGV